MIAVPIGPRVQRFATAAAPAYLDRRGRPAHPRELLGHACLRGRFASGAMPAWEFERDGEIVRVDPSGPLLVAARRRRPTCWSTRRSPASASSIMFEDWLRPHLDSGALEPILEPGGRVFRGRSSIIPVAASCPRRCGRSSTSSRRRATPPKQTGPLRRLCPRATVRRCCTVSAPPRRSSCSWPDCSRSPRRPSTQTRLDDILARGVLKRRRDRRLSAVRRPRRRWRLSGLDVDAAAGARRGARGQGRIRPDPLGGSDARSRRRGFRHRDGRGVGDARAAEDGVLLHAVPARRQDADRPLRRQGQVRRPCGDRPAGGDRDRQSRRDQREVRPRPSSRLRTSKCRATISRSSTSWRRARPT